MVWASEPTVPGGSCGAVRVVSQEVQGLRQREEKLEQASSQVEAVVRDLSAFTDRLEEVRRKRRWAVRKGSGGIRPADHLLAGLPACGRR